METEQMWESKKAKQAADKMYEYFGIFLQSVLLLLIAMKGIYYGWQRAKCFTYTILNICFLTINLSLYSNYPLYR